jgi:uncharacterized membrane protein YccC
MSGLLRPALPPNGDRAGEQHQRNHERGAGVQIEKIRDSRSRHRARDHQCADYRRARHEHERASNRLHRAGEVAEPLAEPDLLEDTHPRSGRVELRQADGDERDAKRDARKQSDQPLRGGWRGFDVELEIGQWCAPTPRFYSC